MSLSLRKRERNHTRRVTSGFIYATRDVENTEFCTAEMFCRLYVLPLIRFHKLHAPTPLLTSKFQALWYRSYDDVRSVYRYSLRQNCYDFQLSLTSRGQHFPIKVGSTRS